MRILIAEDDPVSLRVLRVALERAGHEVEAVTDGTAALGRLLDPDSPELAVLDWMMPGLDGVEVCRRVRAAEGLSPRYLVLLTARGRPEDVAAGLGGGADEYVVKPFDRQELEARVAAGARILALQRALADRVLELEDALARVRRLEGLLPICSYCKKIRDEKSLWHEVEAYVTERSDAQFSHGICPHCFEAHVKPELAALGEERGR